jgi:hypothetical protein
MAAVHDRVSRQWRQGAIPQTHPAQNPERHLVIAGTGRAGTSFLVRYLTELGLDTTLTRKGDAAAWDGPANAGFEDLLIAGRTLPYVVKSPWIGEYIEQILKEERFKIDAFIVPVRDLVEVAAIAGGPVSPARAEGFRGRNSACFSRIPENRGRLEISPQMPATDPAAPNY